MNYITTIIGTLIGGGLLGSIGTYLGTKKKCDTTIKSIKESNIAEINKLKELHKNELEKIQMTYNLDSEKEVKNLMMKYLLNEPVIKNNLNRSVLQQGFQKSNKSKKKKRK